MGDVEDLDDIGGMEDTGDMDDMDDAGGSVEMSWISFCVFL